MLTVRVVNVVAPCGREANYGSDENLASELNDFVFGISHSGCILTFKTLQIISLSRVLFFKEMGRNYFEVC